MKSILAILVNLLPFLQTLMDNIAQFREDRADLIRIKTDLRKIPRAKRFIKKIETLHKEAAKNNYSSEEMMEYYKIEDFRIKTELDTILVEIPDEVVKKEIEKTFRKVRQNRIDRRSTKTAKK